MENNQYKKQKTHNKLERIALGILSIYTVAMFIVAQRTGWNIFAKEMIFVTLFLGWGVHIKQYRSHHFRAKFIAAMSWANFVLYALYTDNYVSMLSTMAGVIVLLGIFCIPQIIYMGIITSTFIFLYHGLIAKTIVITSVNSAILVFLQILSIYTVSCVTWIMIRTQQETNEQLMENIKDLEIAEQSQDDFMVNISHEIRTPINAVCGMSEAVLQEDLPIYVRRDVIDIQTAGRNLLATVSNILDFSELESGKMELAEESYNITSTITDIINMALTMDNGKHLELIVDCDANLPSNLLGDEQKLRRIIMNLLENAIKFTKEGGIILRITSRKEEYGINLVVNIKDSGIGMEQADMEKIFTSFSQVNSKRNREEGGVGLGLAITQALVRRMGGFITVKSVAGSGSEFQFTVPQKVLDETPIVSIKNKSHLFGVCYINMDKFNYSVVREGYTNCIQHITQQFGIMFRICKNLPELKRRMDNENYSHVFISWDEYCEDRNFFEQLAKELTVVIILEYGQETQIGSNMLRIYKPFTVLSLAAVFNGQKVVRNDEKHISTKQRFIAPKAKVLVVDDNAMNLKVMARLLLPYQIKVTMASGGMEALDKLNTMDFDCVFLDHMMPEMDGVETLHKIRQMPGTYFQSLSVIAFTANAIGGAREMFLAEGFDDFIAKPIELSVLERMLRRYIPVHKQIIVEDEEINTAAKEEYVKESNTEPKADTNTKAVSEEEAELSTETEAKALEALKHAGIQIDQGIAYCGDKEGFAEILAIYHKEGAKRKSRLQDYFKEQDWKNYVITVHALKSNSKGIGANELAELALNLEMAGKENRIDYILENHETMLEMHDVLLQVLADNPFVYAKGGTDTVDEVQGQGEGAEETGAYQEPLESHQENNKILKEKIGFLKEKLDSFESEGTGELLDELAKCQYNNISLCELAEQIRERIEEFDFLSASEILNLWEENNHTD